MKRTRKSWSYKIKMYYYRLTFRDIKLFGRKIFSFMFDFIIAVLGFVLIFVLPALFH